MSDGAIESEQGLDPRPLVARPLTNRGVWVFAGTAVLGAAALFAALEARRADHAADPLLPNHVAGEGMINPPPPLAIPETVAGPGDPLGAYAASPVFGAPVVPRAFIPRVAAPSARPASSTPAYVPRASPVYYPPGASPAAGQVGPATVYQAPVTALPSATSEPAGQSGQRVQASRFASPALTIPQGAVIQAVLETALDSTRAGPARAIVSRDVRSFDGSRVLIPRGSRLYGEYKADLATGQNRALIQWTRLMRPDGVTIALDSPSADPLGRAGVTGKVNTHFFARFGGALLDTALNLGLNLATRNVSGGTVILGLPGSTQSVTAPQGETVRPTVKVAQGTQVSVFVARDLDFSEVEQ